MGGLRGKPDRNCHGELFKAVAAFDKVAGFDFQTARY